jgi:hypothetical protein
VSENDVRGPVGVMPSEAHSLLVSVLAHPPTHPPTHSPTHLHVVRLDGAPVGREEPRRGLLHVGVLDAREVGVALLVAGKVGGVCVGLLAGGLELFVCVCVCVRVG